MYVPKTLDRVYVDQIEKAFIVIWIDGERELADLIPLTGNGPTAEDVPWVRLYPAVADSRAPIRADDDSQLRNPSDRWRPLQKFQ
jgi:hypothetical protein